MKNNRLKNSADAGVYRKKLLKEQNGIDPITKELVKDAVLDHCHFDEQRCRGVLQREVNSWEGKVQNSFNRYMRHLTDKPLPEMLRNLADYLEQDCSNKLIHHTALTVDVNKFKRLPATEQKKILLSYDLEPGPNQKKRSLQIRKLIRDGIYKI